MSNFKLTAKPRKLFGRKVKSLRRQNIIPANVFGKKTKSISIQLLKTDLLKIIKEAGETSLIDLTIEGEKSPRAVLISGYAQNPVTDMLLHVDFHQVDLSVTTTATVPLSLEGESPAVAEGNTLVTLKTELEVEALPANLPESILVDISALTQVGDSILAKDLVIDSSKIKLLVDPEETIVAIQAQTKEEVLPTDAETASDEEKVEADQEDVSKDNQSDEKKEADSTPNPDNSKS